MADCGPSNNCCPKGTLFTLDCGESVPQADSSCGCNSESQKQPSQVPVQLDCRGNPCSGNSGDAGCSTGNPFMDGIVGGLMGGLQGSARPNVPGTQPRSPAVNVSNGNLFYGIPVVRGGAYDPPSHFTCNSLAAGQTIQYGSGTAGVYNQTLQWIDSLTVDVIKGDGSAWRYTDLDSGTGFYLAPPGAHNSLRQTMSGWIETQPNGLTLNYSQIASFTYGQLTSLSNRGSQTWTLSYDMSAALSTISDPFGRTTTYTYSGGNLQQITDPGGRITTFTVSGSNLTQILSPTLCLTQHAYDGSNRLTGYTDPAGNTTSYTYDTQGRLATITSPKNETITYNYLPDSDTVGVTDARGNLTTVTFDSDGNVTSVTNPLNQTTNYSWSGNLLMGITDANEHATAFSYISGLGNRTSPVGVIEFADTSTVRNGTKLSATDLPLGASRRC
jgi:YD repeat-containing protein